MKPVRARDNYPLPNLAMNHHRSDTYWQVAATVTGFWCVILLGYVAVTEYQKWMHT
jgi:hypothetical protein